MITSSLLQDNFKIVSKKSNELTIKMDQIKV